MKYLRGYLVAGIFAAITAVLMAYGQRFSTLVDMIYPYVTRTLQTMLAQWSGQVDFCLWQLLAVVLGVLVLPHPASSVAAHASTRTILMIFFMFYLLFILSNFLLRLQF